ncbi:MAG: hypothetical protein HUJ31_06970 [Pseudomonadales bacterium]|nr:hypothetical protein [Pseudomonadales bacterium]
MSKSHRGKGIRNMPARGRGTCPVCKATGIKVLYDKKLKGDITVKVCKRCSVQRTVDDQDSKVSPAVEEAEQEQVVEQAE